MRYLKTFLPLFVFLLFAFACATLQGGPRFHAIPHRDKGEILEDLKKNRTAYSISYGGGSVGLTSALIFDPRDDGRRLTGNRYVAVEDKETLERLISVIESYLIFTPTLYRIYGPEGEFFGFVFTAHYRPFPGMVDDRTLSLPNWKSQAYIGGP